MTVLGLTESSHHVPYSSGMGEKLSSQRPTPEQLQTIGLLLCGITTLNDGVPSVKVWGRPDEQGRVSTTSLQPAHRKGNPSTAVVNRVGESVSMLVLEDDNTYRQTDGMVDGAGAQVADEMIGSLRGIVRTMIEYPDSYMPLSATKH